MKERTMRYRVILEAGTFQPAEVKGEWRTLYRAYRHASEVAKENPGRGVQVQRNRQRSPNRLFLSADGWEMEHRLLVGIVNASVEA
jgi:hypothetical protein